MTMTFLVINITIKLFVHLMRQYLHILSICNISDVHFHLIVFLEVATPDLKHSSNSKLESLVVIRGKPN